MAAKKSGPASSDLPKTSQPALRALNGAGITNLKQLTKFSEEELLALHGMGPKAIGILRAALEEKGWTFAKPKRKQA